MHFRRGLPLDIDEAGYLGFALGDLRGWHQGGLAGLHGAALAQQTSGPLVPLTAAPFLGAFGHTPIVGMSAQLVFLGVLTIASFGLGTALRGRAWGLVTAVVVLLSPGVLDFTRTFHFVLASTAFLCLAVWALIKSDGLLRRWWVVLGGLATGLMLLSRTYTLVFLPGLAVATLVLVLGAGRAHRGRALVNVGLGAAAASAVAAWWWVPNMKSVFDYLTGVGFRNQGYNPKSSPLTAGFWTAPLSQLVSTGLYLGCAAVLMISFLLYLWISVSARRHAAGDARTGMSRVVAGAVSPVGIVAIVTAVSYLALTSGSDRGTGFVVPLIPLVVALGVASIASRGGALRAILAIALVASVAVPAIGKTTVSGPLATFRCVQISTIGCVTVTDSRAVWERELPYVGMSGTNPEAARAGPPGAWVRVVDRAAVWVHETAITSNTFPVVFFASLDPLFNTNTVTLAWSQRYTAPLAAGQLEPDQPRDTQASYLRTLAAPEFGQPTFLFTTDPGRFEYQPRVTQPLTERPPNASGSFSYDPFSSLITVSPGSMSAQFLFRQPQPHEALVLCRIDVTVDIQGVDLSDHIGQPYLPDRPRRRRPDPPGVEPRFWDTRSATRDTCVLPKPGAIELVTALVTAFVTSPGPGAQVGHVTNRDKQPRGVESPSSQNAEPAICERRRHRSRTC